MNPNQSCILISQVWLTKERYLFKEMLELSTKICRKLNPTSFIILSGSGTPPSENTLKFCDEVIWQAENTEFPGNGFPEMIYKGLTFAKNKNFKYIFKFRGDAIIYRPEIYHYCLDIINKEDKSLLITQESTFDNWLGDMVLFGNVNILQKLFDPNKWTNSSKISGNEVLGKRFNQVFRVDPSTDWISALRANCSFRDVPAFKWVDLRYNYESIKGKGDLIFLNHKEQRNYYWGRKHLIHLFDSNNNLIFNKVNWIRDWIYEYSFYQKYNKYINLKSKLRKFFLLQFNFFLIKFNVVDKIIYLKKYKFVYFLVKLIKDFIIYRKLNFRNFK